MMFSFFPKKKKTCSLPLWSKMVAGKYLAYHGGDIDTFIQEFDLMEDEIILLWGGNHLTWSDYQQRISEIQDAKQLFVRFAFH